MRSGNVGGVGREAVSITVTSAVGWFVCVGAVGVAAGIAAAGAGAIDGSRLSQVCSIGWGRKRG